MFILRILRRRAIPQGMLLAFLLGCDPGQQQVGPKGAALSDERVQLADATNQFGLSLMQALGRAPTENVLISPFSVTLALTMALTGAEGSTEGAILKTLNLGDWEARSVAAGYGQMLTELRAADPTVDLAIANSIWHRSDLEVQKEFIDTSQLLLDAEVSALDFWGPDAASTINRWVAEQTRGKISQIVENPMDPSKVMLLINALYFKGDWTTRFSRSETTGRAFQTSAGTKTPIQMMHRKGFLAHLEHRDFQAVDLPYGNGAFSLTVLLPAETIDLDSFAASITQDKWRQWQEQLEVRNGILMMPRFTVQYDRSLLDALRTQGMGIAFTPAADFSGIDASKSIYIGDVKHKTFASVHEEGTEAAAVTSVEMVRMMSITPQFTMTVNRPFLFVIQETETHTMLFVGKIANPSAEQSE